MELGQFWIKTGFTLALAALAACSTISWVVLRARLRRLNAIVERQKTERDAELDHFRATLDAIPDLVWLKDLEGVYLSCNPQFERLFGTSAANIVGRTDYDFVDQELADFFRKNDLRALESGHPCKNEEWLSFARDGYRGLFETIKTPLRGQNGEVIGVLGIARDITARHRATKLARTATTRLNFVLGATGISVWDWDLKRNRWSAASSYYTRRGFKPESRSGVSDNWLERVHPEDRPQVEAAIAAARTGTFAPYQYEARLMQASGKYRWMSTRGVPIKNKSGIATRLVGVRVDITDRKDAEARIQHLAHYDTVTGLPNRTFLDELALRMIKQAQDDRKVMSVLMLEVDNFKHVDNAFGREIGDELIVELVRRIGAGIGRKNKLGRIERDTLVLIMPESGHVQATSMAQRLVEQVMEPFVVEAREIHVTASIGVALFPAHGDDLKALIKSAETALFKAKAQGGDQYALVTDEMQRRAARNLMIETKLRHAIERDELELYYQPQVSLLDGRLTGAEALLRWKNPELGMVSPAEFIPIAEDSGQILKIGSWVLRSATKQLQQWIESDIYSLSMAVNLSAVQFRHPNLPGLIGTILREAELAPGNLELELTERITMDDAAGAIAVMNELHELGVQISIDDFGTGYSSLNYLKRFRASRLKIDQSFVRGVPTDAEDQAIIRTIITLADSLGIETIAEGVETAAQLEFLRSSGCKQAQGYYFSPPVPAVQFAELVRNTGTHGNWLRADQFGSPGSD